MKSEVVKEGWFYLPNLLIGDDGTRSLFVRRYVARRGLKSGKVRVQITTDVWTLDGDAAVADAVRKHEMRELADEAEGDPEFIPPGYRPKDFEPAPTR